MTQRKNWEVPLGINPPQKPIPGGLIPPPDQRRWQRCPVCFGKGIVPHGFYDTPMLAGVATSTAPEQCRACSGRGVLR